MKKIFALLLALVMTLSLVACGGNAANDQQGDAEGSKKIETLKVAFVPSREPEEIITATEPLKQMLKDELAAKVNNGEELTWEDLDSANWSIMGTSSPAGYIYPALWLQDHYGKGISDLKSAVQSDSYASAFARLASGQVDVLVTYADARRDYAERWNSEFGRDASIWEETGVIGVTAPIYNDTISVSKNSEIMDADLIAALQQAFINIGNTDAGKEVIAIYSHNGYQVAQASDYDNARAAQKLIQELSAAN